MDSDFWIRGARHLLYMQPITHPGIEHALTDEEASRLRGRGIEHMLRLDQLQDLATWTFAESLYCGQVGDWDRAVGILDRTLGACEDLPSYSLLWCISERGLAARMLGNPDEALDWWNRGLAGFEALGPAAAEYENSADYVPVLHFHATGLLMQLGLPDLARRNFDLVPEPTEGSASAAILHGWHTLRAEVYAKTQPERAIDFCAASFEALDTWVEQFEAQGSDTEVLESAQAVLALQEGTAYFRMRNQAPRNRTRARNALEDALALGLPEALEEADASILLALLEMEEGHLEEARGLLDQVSTEVFDKRGSSTGLLDLKLRAARSRVERLRQDPDGVSARRLEDLEFHLERFLEAWSRTPLIQGGIGFLEYDVRRFSLGEWIDARLEGGHGDGAERTLDLLIRAQAQGSRARSEGIGACKSDRLRGVLGNEEAMLVYLPAPQGSHLWIVTRDGVRHVDLVPEHELRGAVDGLLPEVLGVPPRDANGHASEESKQSARAAAESVASLLFPDPALEAIRNHDSILVVGSELLGSPPFECLPVDAGPLGLEKILVHAASIPLFVEARVRATPTPRGPCELLAVVAPDQGSAAEELEAGPPVRLSPREGLRLRSTYALGRSWWLQGPRATPEALGEGLRARPRVAQILCHGALIRPRPTPLLDGRVDPGTDRWLAHDARHSALILAPSDPGPAEENATDPSRTPQPKGSSGVLTCADLDRMCRDEGGTPTPPVVILLACGSSDAPLRLGDDGAHHLAGSFLAHGSRDVLHSSANLDRDASVLLAQVFHQELVRGKSIGAALRTARGQLAADPRYDHPHDWALLQLSGQGDGAVFFP